MTTTTTSIHLGPLYAGLALAAQLIDTAGVAVGAPITTSFVEVGSNGDYLWTADVPDGHRGGVLIYEDGTPLVVLAVGAINPEDAEIIAEIQAALAVIDANVDAIKLITDALDTSAVTVTTTNDAGELTIKRSASFAATVSGLTIPADWLAVIWTVKSADSDDDDDAVVQIRASNPAAGTDGLLRIEGALPSGVSLTAADGSVSVDQSEGVVALALKAAATAVLDPRGGAVWDLKVLRPPAGEADELTTGTADVVYTVTHART